MVCPHNRSKKVFFLQNLYFLLRFIYICYYMIKDPVVGLEPLTRGEYHDHCEDGNVIY